MGVTVFSKSFHRPRAAEDSDYTTATSIVTFQHIGRSIANFEYFVDALHIQSHHGVVYHKGGRPPALSGSMLDIDREIDQSIAHPAESVHDGLRNVAMRTRIGGYFDTVIMTPPKDVRSSLYFANSIAVMVDHDLRITVEDLHGFIQGLRVDRFFQNLQFRPSFLETGR